MWRRDMFPGGQPWPHPKRSGLRSGLQCPPNFGDSLHTPIQLLCVWPRTTKFGTVPHVGRAVFPGVRHLMLRRRGLEIPVLGPLHIPLSFHPTKFASVTQLRKRHVFIVELKGEETTAWNFFKPLRRLPVILPRQHALACNARYNNNNNNNNVTITSKAP